MFGSAFGERVEESEFAATREQGSPNQLQRFCSPRCRTRVTSQRLHPAVVSLLRHYRGRLVAALGADSRIATLLDAAGFLPDVSGNLSGLGLADRTAHRLLDGFSLKERHAWRSAWQIHGLLTPNGRETFANCLVAPLLVWEQARPSLVGLPLRALIDSRGLPLRGETDRHALFLPCPISRVFTLTCCSDPFDAALLRSRGEYAIAAFGGSGTPEQIARLAMVLRKLQPRHLRIACATTMRGRLARDAWLAAALAAALRAEVVELPPGCSIRDLRTVSGDAAVTNLLRGHLATRNAPPAHPQLAPSRTPAKPPWASCSTSLPRDLSAYLCHLASCGHGRAECRQRARALALFWCACESERVVSTEQLVAATVERFQADLLERTAATPPMRSRGATIRIMATIRGFLTWALRTGLLTRDLANALAPLRRATVLPPQVLSDDEIERALRTIPLGDRAGLRDRAMLEVLYSSGVRRVELVGLDVADLDPIRRVLRVRHGKGGRTRLVPLGARAATWVQRYVECMRPRQLRDAAEPALFLSRRGRRLGAKAVTARMHACLRAAGITKPGSCHIIRHSVATLMHDAGADIRDLQALLGHAMLTSTQIYTRVSMARLLEVHARTHPAEREVRELGEEEQPDVSPR